MKKTDNAIEIENLSIKLNEFSLKNIDLTVPKGTVMGLIGKNGAGKSTLIKAISDCHAIENGKIYINGIMCSEDRVEYFSKLQTVFDEALFNTELKISKIQKLAPKAYKNFDINFFNEKLKHFEINTKKVFDDLSFGEKKKVQLAFTLALHPQVLILDEPTTGIDPTGRADILDMLMDFMQDENHSILLSTHITSDLDKIADYVTLIDNGKIIFSEDKNDLQEKLRLIRAEKNTFTEKEKSALIGIKENSFGIEAITTDLSLAEKDGVNAVIPTVEEIMIHLVGNSDN